MSATRTAPWGELLLLSILSLSLTACGGGGGGGASTILAFTDESAIAIPGGAGFSASVSGDVLSAAIAVFPNNQGRATVNLEPGTYTVNAVWRRAEEQILLTATETFTVAATDSNKVTTIALRDSELSQGWAKYRAGDYTGAIDLFTSYGARAAAANLGSNSAHNAIGWAHGRNAALSNADTAFNNALTANPNNQDALVGKAGILLLRNSSSADASEAVQRLSQVIDAAGPPYTSAPVHDDIRRADLFACRALALLYLGDTAGAFSNLTALQPALSGASVAGRDLYLTLQLILTN